MADDVENDDQWLYGDNSEQDTNITDPVKVSEPKLSKSKPEEKESVLEDAPKVEVSFLQPGFINHMLYCKKCINIHSFVTEV